MSASAQFETTTGQSLTIEEKDISWAEDLRPGVVRLQLKDRLEPVDLKGDTFSVFDAFDPPKPLEHG